MTIRGPFAVVLVVLLFLSLAANMVVAGFTLTRITGARPGGDVERIVALGTRAFPPEIRKEIASRGADQRGVLRDKLRTVEHARREMFAAMRAEPFDAAALAQAYDALRRATDDLQRAGQEIVAEVLAETPAEVRREIRQRRRGPRLPPR